MATVGIWKITKRLDHVIDYTTNEEKTASTFENDYSDLHQVLEYSTADFKTEKQLYVTALNCSVRTALKEMKITKEQYSKTDKTLGYHAFQSFKEGEVTPSIAHQIGVKLAEEMWGDRFEVIISTHLNTKNYHNHFVLNSVSFKDGKKYYDKRDTYAKLRHTSDSICEEYGISVLKEKKCKKSGINYDNYYKKYLSTNNYYTTTKEDLDRAIALAYSYKDFENILLAMGYETHYRYNKLTIRKEPYRKNIRVERCFGEEYTKENIDKRIETTYEARIPFIEEEYTNKKSYIKYSDYKKQKAIGLYGLYLHYCYLLKIFPKKYPRKILPPEIRVDIKKLDQISKEAELLVSNKITTYEQFFSYKKDVINKYNNLKNKREDLWKKFNKTYDVKEKESIKSEIDNLSSSIKKLKLEVELCEGINERSTRVIDNLEKYYEKDLGKEKVR